MKENIYPAYKLNESNLHTQQLVTEYNSLKSYCPSGIYVLPSLTKLNLWQGVIFLRQGFYKNGTFRFKIEIPSDYPRSIPCICFHDYIYHPLIDPETGFLALGPQFPVWRPGKDFIFSILAYIKKIFYDKELWTAIQFVLNPKALEMSTLDEAMFLQEAQRCAEVSANVERPQKNGEIRFKRFNALHNVILEKIQECRDKPSDFLTFFKSSFI